MKTNQSTTGRNAAALLTLISAWIVGYGIYLYANGGSLGDDFWFAVVFGTFCGWMWIRDEISMRVADKIEQYEAQRTIPPRS